MALSNIKNQAKEKVSQTQESSDSEQSSSPDEGTDTEQGNAGWANSIAKVLNTTKPRTKKTLVLSRAKKIKPGDKDKAQAGYGFEVDGEIKVEKNAEDELDQSAKQAKNQKLELRVKPSWTDIERERTLRKVATRGVVQLFNAVRMQQKDLQQQLEEAGPLDSRKEAVLNNINKRKFLDVLMSGKRAKSEQVDNPVKNEVKQDDSSDDDGGDKKKKTEWNVLRGDFMTNKKIKHWDEEDESDRQASSDNED